MTCQVVEGDGEEVEEMPEIELSSDEEQVRCWVNMYRVFFFLLGNCQYLDGFQTGHLILRLCSVSLVYI